MTKLAMEFILDPMKVVIAGGQVRVDLGNGVTLSTEAPSWVQRINSATLSIVLDVQGSPQDAKPRTTPIE